MAQPLKPWLSIQDQIERLQRRGMQISDEEAAAQWLSAVGYYRLSGYWYPFREIDSTGQARRPSTFVSGHASSWVSLLMVEENRRRISVAAELGSSLEKVENEFFERR
jgi:hypothetical protein